MNDAPKFTEPSHPPAAGRIVLLVEDEPLLRFVIADELRVSGLKVIEATNADEALALLGTRSVDLVLTDVRMPGRIDGLALAKHVRTDHPDIRLVVMSGHFPAQAGATFADAFLRKPFDMSVVAGVLKDLLGRER